MDWNWIIFPFSKAPGKIIKCSKKRQQKQILEIASNDFQNRISSVNILYGRRKLEWNSFHATIEFLISRSRRIKWLFHMCLLCVINKNHIFQPDNFLRRKPSQKNPFKNLSFSGWLEFTVFLPIVIPCCLFPDPVISEFPMESSVREILRAVNDVIPLFAESGEGNWGIASSDKWIFIENFHDFTLWREIFSSSWVSQQTLKYTIPKNIHFPFVPHPRVFQFPWVFYSFCFHTFQLIRRFLSPRSVCSIFSSSSSS